MAEDVKKRFTDTEKWNDRWFRPLSPTSKLLWFWLLDHCDNAGVIDPDMELCSFQIGEAVNEKHFAELGDRLQRLENGKWWIPKFVRFQSGELTTGSQVHRSIIKLIQSHKELPQDNPFISHVNGMNISSACTKDKDIEEEGSQRGPGGNSYHKDSRTVLHILNEASGKHFRETDSNLTFISARLKEPDVTLEGVRKMIDRQCRRWKYTAQEEYLRPETLFNKTKFDGYYAAKDQPINANNTPTQPNPRNVGVARAGISYGDLARRKQAQQQAAMVGKVAQTPISPPSQAGSP